MNKLTLNILFTVLIALTGIQVVMLNMKLSSVSELKQDKVPAAKTRYEKIHTLAQELKVLREKMGTRTKHDKGTLEMSGITKLAKDAGIDPQTPPTIRQWDNRARQGNYIEKWTEVKTAKISAESLFKFLESLEEAGRGARLKILTIQQTRGTKNKFDLIARYSTFASTGKGR